MYLCRSLADTDTRVVARAASMCWAVTRGVNAEVDVDADDVAPLTNVASTLVRRAAVDEAATLVVADAV